MYGLKGGLKLLFSAKKKMANFMCKRDLSRSGFSRLFNQLIKLLILSFLMQSLVWADDFQDNFRKGLEAFKSEQYKEALVYFEKAKSQRANDVRLDYNLGVTYYKLERYKEARNSFLTITDDPDRQSLAYYNLGLVALKQREERQAEEWFMRTLALNDNDKLVLLAEEQLGLLGVNVPTRHRQLGKGIVFVRAGLGYDDNVVLRADDQALSATGKSDSLMELFVYGDKPIYRLGEAIIRLDGNIYSTRYSDIEAYNLTDVFFGGVLEQNLKNWGLDTGAHIDFTFLDGSDYTRTTTFSLQGDRALSRSHKIRLGYRLSKIDDMDIVYNYLAGWRHRGRIDSTWKKDGKKFRLTYRLELNDREDLKTPRFTSYSATRHTLRARGIVPINNKFKTTLEVRYRYSRYNDASEQVDGSFITRTEDRYRFIAKLTYSLGKNTDLIGKYTYTNNDSNIDSKQYTRTQIMMNIAHLW